MLLLGAGVALAIALLPSVALAESPKLALEETADKLVLRRGEVVLATYYLSHPEVRRPFYAHLALPSGIPVTRHFPPREGKDAVDHPTMHPGIWLAFGDVDGIDFWRHKGEIRHERFVERPSLKDGVCRFTVRNQYVFGNGDRTALIATEVCRHEIRVQENQVLLLLDSQISGASEVKPLVFGDQEEMGLGVRVATPLCVKGGSGEIRSSEGKRNEKEAWGRQADWCDYRGRIDDAQIGLLLVPHPKNFRRSWFHVRDYGLMVANPFAQNAFTGGEKSRLEIKPGEKLRLRFAIWLHQEKPGETPDPTAILKEFAEQE